MFGTREEFEYFQCTNCHCLQISQIPENLINFYPRTYYSFNVVPDAPKHGWVYRFFQKQRCRTALFDRGFKLSRVLKEFIELPSEIHEPSGGKAVGEVIRKAGIKSFSARILDIGCGSYSPWLTHLSRLGFRNLTGVDPFIESDRDHGNVRIYKKRLDEIHEKYDFVTLHHSLEHMPNQIDTLKTIASLLSKNGICLIRIPLVSSYAWERYGVNWVEIDAPRHLYLHSLESIKLAANLSGLKLIDLVYDSLPFEFYGSEQYLRDIPLTDSRSLWTNPESNIFTEAERNEFENLANKVNYEKTGGRAGFYFQLAQ